MREKILFVVILTGIKTFLFAGAGFDLPERHFEHYTKYNFASIDSITEIIQASGPESENKYNRTESVHLKNGLFLIDYERFNRNGKILFYNESYNNNIKSQNKINENIEIMLDFNKIEYIDEDTIQIEGNFILKKVILKFDILSKRLISLENYYDVNSIMDYPKIEILFYEYDNCGRLSNIYTFYNERKILRKIIFYDGILRLLDKNFYIDWGIRGTDEIVIYDNTKLLYHLVIRKYSGDMKIPSTIEELNSHYYLVIFEYDDNGNEIKQIKYNKYKSEDYIVNSIYYINNISIDENKNWIERIIYHYRNDEKIIDQEISRIIKYK